jgi:hypothetical protein
LSSTRRNFLCRKAKIGAKDVHVGLVRVNIRKHGREKYKKFYLDEKFDEYNKGMILSYMWILCLNYLNR